MFNSSVTDKWYVFFIFRVANNNFFIIGLTQSPDFELYEGKSLRIGVIGKTPEVREEQVTFNEVSFDKLTNEEINLYDAIFITEENLYQASESKYTNTYLDSTIPFFFISANSHVPFTVKEQEFDEIWNWTPGNKWAVGFLSNEDATLESWGGIQ